MMTMTLTKLGLGCHYGSNHFFWSFCNKVILKKVPLIEDSPKILWHVFIIENIHNLQVE
jgi:hypothetical protein